MPPSPEPRSGDWHETLIDLLVMDRGIPEDRARQFLARHAEEVRAVTSDEEALAEARMWARHGYELGQRSCTWADHGVAPAWLTDGWPAHFGMELPLDQRDATQEELVDAQAAIARVQALIGEWEFMSGRRDARRELLAALEASAEE